MRCTRCGEEQPSRYYFVDEGESSPLVCLTCAAKGAPPPGTPGSGESSAAAKARSERPKGAAVTHAAPWGADVVFPPRCCCCEVGVGPGSVMEFALQRSLESGQTESRVVGVPVCSDCRTHWEATRRSHGCAAQAFGGSTLLMFLLFLSQRTSRMDFDKMSWGEIGVFLISFAVALSAVLGLEAGIIYVFVRPQTEPPHLGGNTLPAEVGVQADGSVRMVFANDRYGAEVGALNASGPAAAL